MRTTIDAAGRLVVPKALRDSLHLRPGQALELTVADGKLELEPAPTPMRLEEREGGVAAVPDGDVPPLTAREVRAALERTRR
jgi:AbrB family looped-hinge helix DNA binding protein